MSYHPTITSYRVLPPRMRIIYPEDSSLSPAERYLASIDQGLHSAELRMGYDGADLVSLVFANQAITSELASRHLADLLSERRELARRHLADLRWRLDELFEQRPLKPRYGLGQPRTRQEQDIERQILDLEKQSREVQLMLWRDTLELRKELASQRQEHHATRRRMQFLAGGSDGGR